MTLTIAIILCRPCLVKPFSNIFYDSDYFAGLTMRFMSLSFTRMVFTTVMPSVAFLTLSSSMAAAHDGLLAAAGGDGDGALELAVHLDGHVHRGGHGLALVIGGPGICMAHLAVLPA